MAYLRVRSGLRIMAVHLSILLAAALVFAGVPAHAATQPGSEPDVPAADILPETDLRYDIQVTVSMEDRTFSGTQRIQWRNPSADTIEAVPIHLYLNAFSNQGSTWMRESRTGHGLGFSTNVLSEEDSWGYLEPKAIRQVIRPQTGLLAPQVARFVSRDGGAANAQERDVSWAPIQPDDGNPTDRTLIEATLPVPLAPGETLVLDIVFEGRLPRPVARTGCIPQMCVFAHWFPKLGAFETAGTRGALKDGFAARQFHAASEFYANFADYTVSIDAPDGLIIGATGQRTAREAQDGRQVVTYAQRAVHDFAFVLGTFEEYTSTFTPGNGGPSVSIRYLPFAGRGFDLERAKKAVHGAMAVMNERVGPYPYETLTIAYPPIQGLFLVGMEYPTLITGLFVDRVFYEWPGSELLAMESTDVHEIVHQYFQHLVATNEQEEAFLDEGFTSYWEREIMAAVYGRDGSGGTRFGRPFDALLDQQANRAYGRLREPLAKQPTSLFYPGTTGRQVYSRPAVTVRTAANLFGQDRMDAVFKAYFEQWRFGHPDVEDFLTVARETGGADLEAFLREGFFSPRHPDFRLGRVTSRPYQLPLGRHVDADGEPVIVTRENREEYRDLLIPERARETDGQVWVEITDPGWADGQNTPEGTRAGTVTWQPLAPTSGAVSPVTGETLADTQFHETIVRLTGPAWKQLPVEVAFRFEDGIEARLLWDRQAAWQGYRFLRPAKLSAVEIDPDRRIALDSWPMTNGRLMEPDKGLERDWTLWTVILVEALSAVIWGAF